MNDLERLQGYWRLVSITIGGQPAGTSITHWRFDGDVVKEISPHLVESGEVRTTVWLDAMARPRQNVLTSEFLSEDADAAGSRFVECGFYELKGDALQIRFGSVAGRFPESFDEEFGRLESLERHVGPPPPSKQPSGRQAIVDDLLGRLGWNDDVNWYSGKLPGQNIRISLSPDVDLNVSVAQARARAVVSSIDDYGPRVADYAVQQLLDLKNDAWLEEDEEAISADEFKSRMRLESITFDSDGSVTFYHHDGDLFWGHCIQIGMDHEDQFVFADIPG